MQFDHSKRTLDYILATPDLETVEVVCTLSPSTKCSLPRPFFFFAQFDKNVGRLNFVYNLLRPGPD